MFFNFQAILKMYIFEVVTFFLAYNPWCPRGSLPPLENSTPYALPQPFQATRLPPSPSFRQSHKTVESGRYATKIPLSGGEEKHVDTYMVINTTTNKTKFSLRRNPKNEDINF